MKHIIIALTFLALNSQAAVKTYQVTGPITEINDTTVTVDKGGEKWTLQKDATTKVTGELKVGTKVTIKYSMTATDIEAKAEKAKK